MYPRKFGEESRVLSLRVPKSMHAYFKSILELHLELAKRDPNSVVTTLRSMQEKQTCQPPI